MPLPVPQRRVLDLAVVSTWSLAARRRATERPGSRVKISSLGENVQWTSLRHQNSRSCGSLRDCRPGCGSSLNARLVRMLAAADHGLDDLAAFLDPEPSRGSVHDQRDVAPSLQHCEHSVVDAVTEHRALELPFALRCMYRERPANVAVTHAVTLARKRGAKDAGFGAAAAPVGPALDRVLADQAYPLATRGHGRRSGGREIPAGAAEARGASAAGLQVPSGQSR